MKTTRQDWTDEFYADLEVAAGSLTPDDWIKTIVEHRVRYDPQVQAFRRERREQTNQLATNLLNTLIEAAPAVGERRVREVWQQSLATTATLDDAFERSLHELGLKTPGGE